MSRPAYKERADRLRAVPLESVLRAWGACPDPYDPAKWHTSQGTLSVNGAKFINWSRGAGGGGAIDLVIHLNRLSFTEALQWLERHFPDPLRLAPSPSSPKTELRLPRAQPAHLGRIRQYLLTQRALPDAFIDPLIQTGKLYADHRANAVFLLLGKENEPVGAELRGTGPVTWRGMAPGSQKDLGFFSIPVCSPDCVVGAARGIILCESAIDALSCRVLHPQHLCISTSGARPNPQWLPALIESTPAIYCGFDTDEVGERMAQAMISLHPVIQRLRPSHHDWNDTLRASR